jgi:HD-GYP domain-containing protein (c-di-GMP phosphodiesterase class II)
MDNPNIILEANLPGTGSRSWTSPAHLRIGRIPDLEIVLNDDSISRRHAEVVLVDEGWVVRDLGSSNGTFLNGTRVGRTGQRIRQSDTIRVGRISFRVDQIRELTAPVPGGSRAELNQTVVPSAHKGDRFGAPGKGNHPDIATVLHLIRNGSRLTDCGLGNPDLQQLLDETLAYFGAQRCGLLFSATPARFLELRFVSVAPDRLELPRSVSKSAATKALDRKESLLFQDTRRSADLASAGSFVQSATASIICAVIRSPSRVFGVLHLERGPHQQLFAESELYLADALADALAVGLERIHMAELQRDIVVQAVTALAQAVEMRDEYTGNHTNRVTTYSVLLAEELGLPDDQRQLLRVSAALHDIGKIAIDDQVLRKPGRLSEAEYAQMQTHVTRGAEIIETMPGLAWALPVVRSHHERWDGAGYPDGLIGEQIPLKARIVSVADAFDAMTSDRPYRRGMAAEVAFNEIRAGAGKQFDPTCVQAFLRIRKKIERLLDEEKLFSLRAERASNTISVQELKRESAAVKMALSERAACASV